MALYGLNNDQYLFQRKLVYLLDFLPDFLQIVHFKQQTEISSVFLISNKERSGRVLDLRPRSRGFEPHWGHCVVVLEQNTFILA